MYLLFTEHRARAHLPAVDGVTRAVEAGSVQARILRGRFDELRRLCTGTAPDFAGAKHQADEVGGVWAIDTRDWSSQWIPANRDSARDEAVVAEERAWADARRLRDGWQRRRSA